MRCDLKDWVVENRLLCFRLRSVVHQNAGCSSSRHKEDESNRVRTRCKERKAIWTDAKEIQTPERETPAGGGVQG